MSMKQRVISACGFVFSGFAAAQTIRIIGNLISTRILDPELFGVMLLGTALMVGATMITDAGLTSNIMRHRNGANKEFLQTAFSIKVLQGLLIALVLAVVAAGVGWLATLGAFPSDSVYAHDNLPEAILILALSALVRSFASIEIELSRRKLAFGRVVGLEIIAQILSVLFIIGYGSFHPTIYALAYASVISAATVVAGSYALLPRTNIGFRWDTEIARETFHYGKWIAGSSTIGMLSMHADKFIFGYLFDSKQLGQYAIASLITTAIAGVFQKTNNVWLPAFGEIVRNHPERLSAIYYRVRLYRDVVVCAAAGVLLMAGDLLIDLLYDNRYSGAGWMLQLLGLSFLIEAFRSIKQEIVLAHGKSQLLFKITLARTFSTLTSIAVFYHLFGVAGAIFAYTMKYLPETIVLLRFFFVFGYLKIKGELRTIGVIAVSMLLGLIVRFSLQSIKQLGAF